jgi:hypothetical protein
MNYRMRHRRNAPLGAVRVSNNVCGSTTEILAIMTKSGAEAWLGNSEIRCETGSAIRNHGPSLAILREAEGEEMVIARNGEPAGLLIGFGSEDDWRDHRLDNDPRFLRRIEKARESLRAGRGVRVEDVE